MTPLAVVPGDLVRRSLQIIEVEESITINRAIEEVFAFVADQTNAPRWQSGLLEARRTTKGLQDLLVQNNPAIPSLGAAPRPVATD